MPASGRRSRIAPKLTRMASRVVSRLVSGTSVVRLNTATGSRATVRTVKATNAQNQPSNGRRNKA